MSGMDEKAVAIAEAAYLAAPIGEGLRAYLRAYLASITPADVGELVERLRHLISLDEPKNGGPYGGLAARECLRAMSEAATALERVVRERDHWRAYSAGQGKLIESGVFIKNDDYIALVKGRESAEAKLAKARKVIEPFADISDLVDSETEGMADSDEFELLFHDYLLAKWPLSTFRAARRWIEETK